MTTDLRALVDQLKRGYSLTLKEAEAIEAALDAQAVDAKPYGYVLRTGHGIAFRDEIPDCEIPGLWVPVYRGPVEGGGDVR